MKTNTDLNTGGVKFNGWIWQTANQFNLAANSLYDSDIAQYSTVVLMNYAFACELALKACAVQTRHNCKPTGNGIIPTASFKSEVRGHDLAKVFADLPEHTRTAISENFDLLTDDDLHSKLTEFKDYFVDIRYSFEQRPRSYDLSGMRNLANGLVEATLDAAKTTDGFTN